MKATVPSLQCCATARRVPGMVSFYVTGDSTVPAEPMWRLSFDSAIIGEDAKWENYYAASKAVKFCPWCGTHVPEVKLKAKPPAKVCKFSDGGYYCDTCQRRGVDCTCNPPEAAWEIK